MKGFLPSPLTRASKDYSASSTSRCRASMPKRQLRWCSQTVVIYARVPTAYGHWRVHAQAIIAFQESIPSPERPCPNHKNVRIPQAHSHQSVHAQTMITFVSTAYDHQSMDALAQLCRKGTGFEVYSKQSDRALRCRCLAPAVP